MPRPDSSVVERGPEKAGVGGSIPSLATTFQQSSSRIVPPILSCVEQPALRFSTIEEAAGPPSSWHPMTMKKTTPARPRPRTAPSQPFSPYGRLDALLHTVRCIAQHEDALCELSHEVKQSGVLSEETKLALDTLLKKLPSQEYVHDFDAVTVLLASSARQASSTPTKKTASAPARKRSPAKQKSGRKSSN